MMIRKQRLLKALGPAFAVCVMLLATRPADAEVSWPSNPTPITFRDFEIGVTPAGRLISWTGAGERKIRGYRVQARQPGERWRLVSPLIPSQRGGTEEQQGDYQQFYHSGHRGFHALRRTHVSQSVSRAPRSTVDPRA